MLLKPKNRITNKQLPKRDDRKIKKAYLESSKKATTQEAFYSLHGLNLNKNKINNF